MSSARSRASTLLAGLLAVTAWAEPSGTSDDPEPLDPVEPTATSSANHQRLETPRGALHLYRPAGFSSETAGTVIYVHGYYTSVDDAWTDHALARQFDASGRNALFVVPEAPRGDDEAVRWPSLEQLLAAVEREGGLEIPAGPLVVVAHSGGFRSLQGWLDSGKVDGVVLLDGLYGAESELARWLDQGGNHPGSLVLVGADTTRRIERFVQRCGDYSELASVPVTPESREDGERVIFLRSPYGHMQMVTEGRVIAPLLRLMRLRDVGHAR